MEAIKKINISSEHQLNKITPSSNNQYEFDDDEVEMGEVPVLSHQAH